MRTLLNKSNYIKANENNSNVFLMSLVCIKQLLTFLQINIIIKSTKEKR